MTEPPERARPPRIGSKSIAASAFFLRLLDRAPDSLGLERQLDMLDAERPQRIEHCVGDAGIAGDRARLADTLGAERIDRRRRDRIGDLETREHFRARHRVVHQAAAQELAALIVNNLLAQRLPNSLGQAAMDLTVD